jgi:hypothetical protein
MFIWGTKSRKTPVGGGAFFCPSCRRQTDYSLIRVSKCSHVYFIPLGSGQTLGEYVVCDACGGQYDAQVLSKDAASYASTGQSWECPNCRNSNPAGDDECLRCHRWVCSNCQYDNASTSRECTRCRTRRGGDTSGF